MTNREAQLEFAIWARERGIRITRRGAPDLWIVGPEFAAVKVRSSRRRGVRTDRRLVLQELEALGVPVLLWAADDPELRPVRLRDRDA